MQDRRLDTKEIIVNLLKSGDMGKIPTVVNQSILYPMLDSASLTMLAQTNKNRYTSLKPELTQRLLNHVIRGEEKAARFIIEKFPSLLLEKGRVRDYSGRDIEGTAFRLALGAEDEEMCEMIDPYFNRLENGSEERTRQAQQQFPTQEQKSEESADITALKYVTEVISKSQVGEDCKEALEQFRNTLKPKGVIQTGWHFNARLLLAAYQLANEHQKAFGGHQSPKNVLFLTKLIGYIHRYLTSCYAQAFCHEYYISGVERRTKVKLTRSFELIYPSETFFFPLSESSGLGFDSYVSALSATLTDYEYTSSSTILKFTKFCLAKRERLKKYLPKGAYSDDDVFHTVIRNMPAPPEIDYSLSTRTHNGVTYTLE